MESGSSEPQPAGAEPSAHAILACAAESDRRMAVLAAAVEAAQRQQVRLILYDMDAASSWVGSLPELDSDGYQHPLSPEELRGLGRGRLAEQVEQARSQGVDAFGWLPRGPGADAMVAYAREVGATTVMLSAELETPTFMQRLHNLTARRAKQRAGEDVTVVLIPG